MGHMKDFDRRIRQGGDDAIAAACELAGIAKERRGYEDTMNATGDITDIVTVLRGVGFAAVPPSARATGQEKQLRPLVWQVQSGRHERHRQRTTRPVIFVQVSRLFVRTRC